MYRIISLFLLLNTIFVDGVEFTDCGSTAGKYSNVTVTNCDSNSPTDCILARGTDATINIEFTLTEDVNQVNANVHGILQGIPVPFPIAEPNACTAPSSGLKCPLSKSGGPYHYKSTLHIDEKYPKVKVVVKWELRNEKNEDIICVTIPSKIQ